MRQSINEVEISGKLSELDLRHGITKDSKDYIAGNIIVEVPVEGETGVFNLVPVNVFATKITKAGKPNPGYKGLEDLEDNAVSIAAGGRDKANDIKVNAGSISENSYYGQTGNLINGYRVNGSFFTTKGVVGAKAAFKHEIVILNMAEEVKNDEETGRLLLTGAIVQYGDKLDVLNYVIESPLGIKYAQNTWEKGNTVIVAGVIRQMPIEDKKAPLEGGFGVLEESKTKIVRELVISFGSEAKDDDESFAANDITQGLVARKERLEAEKAKQEVKEKTTGAAPTKKAGFDF